MISPLVQRVAEIVFSPLALTESSQVPPHSRFLAIPGRGQFRWIVPVDPQWGRKTLSQWRPYSLLSLIKWKFLLTAYSWQALAMVPGVEAFGIEGLQDFRWPFERELPSELRPVIYIGTAGPTQKAVVFLAPRGNDPLAGVAKYPLGERAVEKIQWEGEILKALEREKKITAPRLLDKRLGATLQEALAGRPVSMSLTRSHIEWLKNMSQGGELSWEEVWNPLVKRAREIDFAPKGSEFSSLLETPESCDSQSFPRCLNHGDFVPWNLKWIGEDQLAAVDWESAIFEGLPLVDLLHYYFMIKYLFGRRENLTQFLHRPLCQEYIQSFSLGEEEIEKLIDYYLLKTSVEYWEEGKRDFPSFLLTERE